MAGDDPVLGDRYQLEERLGAGGAAVVWRAIDLLLDREVAIKLLRDEVSDLTTHDRFRQEAVAAAGIRHPNVVTVYDMGEDGDRDYLVLELVDGPSLADVLADHGALPPGAVAAIGHAVATALGAAHGQGLVHRDVKPANVLLTADGAVKVTDFGIAKALGPSQTRLTTPGTILGTVTYLAPEQLTDDGVDPRTDVYALGLVLHECLTGRPVFDEGTTPEVAMARIGQDPPPPSERAAGVPDVLDEVISRCLARAPDARPDDGAAVADALASLVPDDAGSAVRKLVGGPHGDDGPAKTERIGGPPTGGGAETASTAVVGAGPPREPTARAAAGDERASRRGPQPSRPSDRGSEPEDRRGAWLSPARAGLLVLLAALAVGALLLVGLPTGDEAPDEPAEPVAVTASSDHDPFGDGEHPERVADAHDGDAATSWTTQRYNSADLGGLKPGVGAWFDLGEARGVATVEIDLVIPGADLEIYALDDEPGSDPDDWGEPAARVEDADEESRIELDEVVEGRYWLLWFTSLPPEGGRHRTEVAEIRFLPG